MTQTEVLIGAAVIVVVCLVLDWMMRFWQQSQVQARRNAAQVFLRTRGMEAHLYLASFGEQDEEMRNALAAFDHTGYIVLDRSGAPVGRLLPKVGPRKGLRLVVDNTK